MIGWFTGLKLAGKLAVLAAVLAALVGLWMLWNARDERLRQSGRDEITAQWQAEKRAVAEVQAKFSADIIGALQPRFDALTVAIGGIDSEAARINLTLPPAVASDPRYRDPNCALTAPVLDAVNAARALSGDRP